MASRMPSTEVFSPQVHQVLTNISNRLFHQEPSSYSYMKEELPGNEVVTSEPLQILLFFNVLFFPFWLISEALMLNIKYTYLFDTYKVLLIAILVLYSLIEVIRLYLGYVGNLQEKLPELAGFLLFSFIPQLLLVLFLLFNSFTIILPLDRAVNIVLLVLVFFEIVFACFTCKAMSKQQENKFHLQQFVDLEQLPAQDVDQVYAEPHNTVTRRNPGRA